MDRRSWLWRRKSSEKSPGETDSSGSISSHSERFSDDQAYQTHNSQPPEVTSKAFHTDDEDDVKIIKEKLSAALLNISSKEDLIKQHAKVSEEAVSGWEKAEKEVLTLKQQLEVATKRNSRLEDRVGHLDAALKECVRQLRQAREEQDQKIKEALVKRIHEWESTKSEFESQLVELKTQLLTAKSETSASIDSDLQKKLEAAENGNSFLKHQILSQAEELEIRTLERDLSAQAAETASKQHLESIKKVAKLEAECRRLKALARKASLANDHKSFTASSIYVESFTDSQSDSGERLLAVESDIHKMSGLETNECNPSCSSSCVSALITELDQFKNHKALGRNLMPPSMDINLMDDFLEMERLAALPDTESGTSLLEAGPVPEQTNSSESPWKAELEAMINRTSELEEKLEKLEDEKVKLEIALNNCLGQVQTLQSQLKEADTNLEDIQVQLALANKALQTREEEIRDMSALREMAESQHRIAEAEIKNLFTKVDSLSAEVEKERALSAENIAMCHKLEDEISKLKHEAEVQHEAELRCIENFNGDLKIKQEKELAIVASKFAECQRTISSLGHRLKSLATMDDYLLDSEISTDLTSEGLQVRSMNGGERWRLHSSDLYSTREDSKSFKLASDALVNQSLTITSSHVCH